MDTLVEFRGIRRVSQVRFHDPTPRFPPSAPAGGSSPTSAVLSRRYDFLPLVPPRFVAFAQRYLSVHSFFSLLGGRVDRRGLELVARYLQPDSTEGTTGAPKFLGNSNDPFAHVPATPAGLLAPDRSGAALLPLVIERQRLPREVFRRSIAWLLDSLSTPRSARLPGRHARLASGRWSGVTGRAFTRRVPLKGFRFASYISFSFPKLGLAQSMPPPAQKRSYARPPSFAGRQVIVKRPDHAIDFSARMEI